MSTHFLSYWARDRGLVSVPHAVHKLTGFAAGVLGLADRGTLQVGKAADINVVDLARLGSQHPVYVNDFPGGAGRLQIGGRGYAATLVNGTVVAEHGVNSGARPGRVLREFSRG